MNSFSARLKAALRTCAYRSSKSTAFSMPPFRAFCFFLSRGAVIGPTFHFNVSELKFGDVAYGKCHIQIAL